MLLTNDYVLQVTSGSLSRKIKRDFPKEHVVISNISEVEDFKEKVFLYLNPNTVYVCKRCTQKTKMRRYSQGFSDFCSVKCRGQAARTVTKKLPVITEHNVTYWPLYHVVVDIAKNPNYSKAQVKREFFEFYCFVQHSFEYTNFNEKLFAYLNNSSISSSSCKTCNGVTQFSPKDFRFKNFCSRQCANIYNKPYLTGGYNAKYFQQYPKEKSKPAQFYFIELANNKERFLKIGITCRDFKIRKNEICGSKYIVTILYTKETTLYECHLLENRLLSDNTIRKYVPSNHISGKTECFDITEKNSIRKLI
jgi:endogenous inhibitor of DNA gyrase (YacG/DUF329 family)